MKNSVLDRGPLWISLGRTGPPPTPQYDPGPGPVPGYVTRKGGVSPVQVSLPRGWIAVSPGGTGFQPPLTPGGRYTAVTVFPGKEIATFSPGSRTRGTPASRPSPASSPSPASTPSTARVRFHPTPSSSPGSVLQAVGKKTLYWTPQFGAEEEPPAVERMFRRSRLK
jgi:hypothetical protein